MKGTLELFQWHAQKSLEESKIKTKKRSSKWSQCQCLKFTTSTSSICSRTQSTDRKKAWKSESKRTKASLLRGSVCSPSKRMMRLRSTLSTERPSEQSEQPTWMQLLLERTRSLPLLWLKSSWRKEKQQIWKLHR